MPRNVVLQLPLKLLGIVLMLVCLVAVRCPAATPEDAERLATDDLVRPAFEAELRGDNQQREQLLNRVLQQNRNHLVAHWHAGHVRVGRRWMKLDEAAETAANNDLLKRYHEIRGDFSERMPPHGW